ncbi:uncharacterized protein LOC134181880 isoform X2 [Corticium candelabrum]|uniref:uncharacterized protein LOC134181880 isoform X2 n=1 Tax=Corticium candelabrum TaxID=121492 RepID=UPI002E273C40|nr:uncharacterized protein LOC134181880 isoform X2 [Corticium candelabrum]
MGSLLFYYVMVISLVQSKGKDNLKVQSCDDWSIACMADSKCRFSHINFVEHCGNHAVKLATNSTDECPDVCKQAFGQVDSDADNYCPCYGLKVSPGTSQELLELNCDEISAPLAETCGSVLTRKLHLIALLVVLISTYINTV